MIQRLLNIRSWVAALIAAVIALLVFFFSGICNNHQPNVSHWLLGERAGYPPTSMWLSVAILISLGFLLRRLFNRLKLSYKKGYYQPAILALMLIPLAGPFSLLEISAAACAILASFMVFSTYQTSKPRPGIHRVGIALGVATLLEPSFLWAILIVIGMLLRLGQRNWRNEVVLVFGILFPFVMLAIALLLMNTYSVATSFIEDIQSFHPPSINVISWLPAVVVLMASIFGLAHKFFSGSVRERELLQTFLVWLIGAVALGIFGAVNFELAIMFALIPATGFVSLWLENAPKFWLADVVVLVLASAFLLV